MVVPRPLNAALCQQGNKEVTLRQISIAVIVGVIVTISTYGGLVLFLTWPVSEFSIAKAGTFGDSFGVVTSFFSGLAFAGIILTIVLQRQELTESREIFRIQRFEGSFYRLLDLYRKNLEDIRIEDRASGSLYQGIDALSYTCRKINESMQKYARFLEIEDGRVIYEVQLFIEIQKLLHKQARYLGTLQNILELIERDLPIESEREPYWDIISGQITSAEAKYIFYCCLVSEKGSKFLHLMHRSGLIVNRVGNANLSTTHRALYLRIHGIEIPRARTQLVTPYPRSEFKRLKKQIRKVTKSNASSDKA